jgi:hypothetical protein
MNLSFQTDGTRESITTPAGEFPQAIKVSHTLIMSVTLNLPSGGTSGALKLKTSHWYEPYVGLVRAQIDSTTVRTLGTDIPASIESTVELIKFTGGN